MFNYPKERIVYLLDDINDLSASDTVRKLINLDSEKNDTINLIISSDGGDIDAFFTIHEALQIITSDVNIICIGRCYSCAATLLFGGKIGRRYMTPNSQMMIHKPYIKTKGGIEQVRSELKGVDFYTDFVEDLLRYCLQDKNKTSQDLLKETDVYLTSQEALSLGLIDGIVPDIKRIFNE